MKLTAPNPSTTRVVNTCTLYHLTPASSQTNGQGATVTVVSPSTVGFTLIIFLPIVHYNYLQSTLLRGAGGRNLGTLKYAMIFQIPEALKSKELSLRVQSLRTLIQNFGGCYKDYKIPRHYIKMLYGLQDTSTLYRVRHLTLPILKVG